MLQCKKRQKIMISRENSALNEYIFCYLLCWVYLMKKEDFG